MCRYVLSSCCDVRYDFRVKTMFGSSLPPVVCRRAHLLFTLFVFVSLDCPRLMPFGILKRLIAMHKE
jgi:hypothetical protein